MVKVQQCMKASTASNDVLVCPVPIGLSRGFIASNTWEETSHVLIQFFVSVLRDRQSQHYDFLCLCELGKRTKNTIKMHFFRCSRQSILYSLHCIYQCLLEILYSPSHDICVAYFENIGLSWRPRSTRKDSESGSRSGEWCFTTFTDCHVCARSTNNDDVHMRRR